MSSFTENMTTTFRQWNGIFDKIHSIWQLRTLIPWLYRFRNWLVLKHIRDIFSKVHVVAQFHYEDLVPMMRSLFTSEIVCISRRPLSSYPSNVAFAHFNNPFRIRSWCLLTFSIIFLSQLLAGLSLDAKRSTATTVSYWFIEMKFNKILRLKMLR